MAVPPGFATTADAYWQFVDANQLTDIMAATIQELKDGRATLSETGQTIRRPFAWNVAGRHYKTHPRCIANFDRIGKADADVAVRSSATAEDLPDASFAGQQETFLNVRGETAVLDACRRL